MEVKGDLFVRRTGIFDRRADQALIEPAALAATRSLLRHSHYWQRLTTDDLGVEKVALPDATTLPEGWTVVVDNAGSTERPNGRHGCHCGHCIQTRLDGR